MENNDYINEIIHKKLGLNSTLKKCQSLIDLQRMMLIKEYNIKNQELLEKYYLNDDITNKQSNDVINSKIKNIFNMNNYEQNIKSEAWQKDMSKMFLGLNDENKGKSENAYFEYNYNNRNKKKEGLLFIRNFFGKMKSAKKIKNIYNKKIDKIFDKNKFENYKYKYKYEKKEEKSRNKEKDVNKIWNQISHKYNHNFSLKESKMKMNDYNNIRLLTEIKNSKSNKNFINKYKIKKNIFPEIASSNSTKNIKNKKNMQISKIYGNKTFNEQLKSIYIGQNKYKYMTINTEEKNKNFDMPDLLEHKKIPLFKKNRKVYLSPLHYSKYEQMMEIKNKLIKVGLHDKEVFKIYNKNV